MISDLKKICAEWDKSNEQFASIVSVAVASLKDCDFYLATKFEVAESTVKRWASGVARPAPTIQAEIILCIENMIRQYLISSGSFVSVIPEPLPTRLTHFRCVDGKAVWESEELENRWIVTGTTDDGRKVLQHVQTHRELIAPESHLVLMSEIGLPKQ